MKPSSRYALAFSLALLPPVIWVGGESVEQEREEVCCHCGTTHHLTERGWFIWGWHGNEVLRDEMYPSPVLRDFPAFRCSHDWSHVGTKSFQGWDSPLCAIRPSPEPAKRITFGGEIPIPLLYNRDAEFRDLLNEAMEAELATHEQITRWLELRGVNPPEDGESDEDDDVAFAKLDATRSRLTGRPPRQTVVRVPLPELPPLPGRPKI